MKREFELTLAKTTLCDNCESYMIQLDNVTIATFTLGPRWDYITGRIEDHFGRLFNIDVYDIDSYIDFIMSFDYIKEA